MAYRNNPNLFEIHPIDDMFSSFDVFNQKLSKHKTKQYKKVRKEAQRLLYKEKQYIPGLKLFFKYLWLKLQKKNN